MFEQTINERMVLAMQGLSAYPEISGQFYLAGGTALALKLGHRKSEDLDFFTSEEFDTNRIVEIFKEKKGEIRTEVRQTVHGEIDGAKISFIGYSYPLLEPLKQQEKIHGITLASVMDIACMKLVTLSQRGEKKDFYDVYELLKSISMKEFKGALLKKYSEKYAGLYAIARSLIYFADAEDSLQPQSLNGTNWEEVKKFFLANEKKFTQELIG